MSTLKYDFPLSPNRSSTRWHARLASWKSYALAGGASLAAGTSADAQIVHTMVNQSISGDTGSSVVQFAINGHGVTALNFVEGAGTTVAGIIQGNGVSFFATGIQLHKYNRGAAIAGTHSLVPEGYVRFVEHPSAGVWMTGGQFAGPGNPSNRAPAVQGFIGFQTTGSNQDKGWIQVVVGPSTNSIPTVAIDVIDYAYNSSGGPINAGQTSSVPEPGTMALALMAAGAAGIASIRKARAKFITVCQNDSKSL